MRTMMRPQVLRQSLQHHDMKSGYRQFMKTSMFPVRRASLSFPRSWHRLWTKPEEQLEVHQISVVPRIAQSIPFVTRHIIDSWLTAMASFTDLLKTETSCVATESHECSLSTSYLVLPRTVRSTRVDMLAYWQVAAADRNPLHK